MHLLPKLRRYILACVSETVTSGQRHTVVVSSGLREDPQSGNYILDFDIGVHPAQQVVVIDLPGSDEIQ